MKPTSIIKLSKNFAILLLLSLCCACNGNKIQPRSSNRTAIKPVISSSHKNMSAPQIFEAAFYPDTKVIQNNGPYFFYRQEIGTLKCESGKIIACNPAQIDLAVPFDHCFPTGLFPVQLAIAKRNQDEKVAFARILFSDRHVASWKLADMEVRTFGPLQDTCKSCYTTDSGRGIFIGEFSKDRFRQMDENLQKDTFYNRPLNFKNTSLIYEFDNYNLAIFPTGEGPGCYKTYLGFDKRGIICQLLTDFELIPWWNLNEENGI